MKKLTQVSAAVAAFGAAAAAHAEVPSAVTTAMTSMGTDAIAVATAFLVAIIGVAAFKMMKKGAS